MTRIIYVVYTKEYLTPWQIIGANLKKYAFLCDYSEVKIDDLIDSPMYSTPMQVVSISPCESLADDVVKVNNSYSKVVKKNTNGSLSCLSYWEITR